MSTSFDVETNFDRIPTVRELIDGLKKLEQFERANIQTDLQ